MKIILFTVVFITEVYLSHQNGSNSGAESRVLSEHLHLNEHLIRTSAHIGFFAVLIFLSLFISPWISIAIILWTIIDEATKPLLKNERHFSWIDVGWNFVGVVVSTVVWMLTQWFETLVS